MRFTADTLREAFFECDENWDCLAKWLNNLIAKNEEAIEKRTIQFPRGEGG